MVYFKDLKILTHWALEYYIESYIESVSGTPYNLRLFRLKTKFTKAIASIQNRIFECDFSHLMLKRDLKT